MVQVPSAQRTRWSMLCLALLTCLLTLSTFIHLPEGVFATFTIMAGIALAATGSYLQTSVIAVASLFGPTAIQSLISGQAVVAVVLSAVQLIGAAGSLHSSQAGPTDGVAETRSARLFFGISMTFLLACGAANAWMTRLPSFRAVIPNDEPWVLPRRLSISADPRSPRSPMLGGPLASVPDPKAIWDRILSVARRNIIYELAVAYVFIITLVSRCASLFKLHSLMDVIWHTVCLSRHHDINCPHQPSDTPTLFQFTPFPRLQYWRLVWTISLQFPAAPCLACKATACSLARADTPYTALPGL